MSQNASPFLTIINNSGIQFSFYELRTCVRVNWPSGEGQIPNKYFLQVSREKILAKIEKREYPQLARGQVTLAPLPESAGKISSLICRDIKENERDKLLGIFRKFYNTLQTHKQKVAYLCYLLHYQHYNAEYTEEECKRLGYPFPLSALQRQPGYFRFEHERLMKLMEPWLGKNVSVLNRQRDVKPFSLLTPTTNLAIAVFKQFFIILTVDEFRGLKEIPAETVGVILPVSRKDLSEKRGDQIIEQYVGKLTDMQKKRVFFLFGLKPQPIDCILTWIGEWRVCSGRLWFDYFSLDARFGNNIFSLLKECGAVPDRISVNQFVTYGLDKASFDEAFNQCLRTQNSLRPNPWRVGAYTSSSNNWEKIMEGIALFNFKEEQGCEIFRDAILKWSNLLFSDSTLFNAAAPLLSAEVCPWLQKNGDLVSWSKGYQNLVEIVMFLIQAFPEKFQGYSFERDLLQKLPETKHRAVGLFSYGMTGFYEVMNIILMRYRAQSPNVACISQSYFEMLMLLREMQRTRKIGVNEYASLDKIQKLPNVLVADIHPNNAARKQLFQNNVGGWVKEQLDRENGRTLCLVLDITLNHLSDPIIEQTFKDLLPYIEAGRLHLFGIQSLAKLVQLGADNFSGGATFYLGNDDTIKFSTPIREKSAFFALMNKEFQEHIDRYLNLVRENTEYLYLTLNRLTLDIEKRIKIKRNDQEGEVSFCAAQITTNVDSQTVYVALHFRNLLNEWGVHENDDNQVKILVKQLKKILIQAADVRGLPLTERQSFGFSLMSVSDVKDAIRISVGMEGKPLLDEYAELIYDFNYCLSKYIAHFENGRELNAFEEIFLRANKIAEGKELYFGERIDIFEEVCDENGRDIFDKRGGAQVVFTNGNIELKCYDNEGALYSVIKDPRMIRVGSRMMSIGQIESVKIPLLFHLCMLGTRQLTVFMEYATSYLVDGFFEDILEWSFLERGDIRDPSSGVVLKINPSLSMVYQGIKYKEDKIYIIDSHFGGNPA
ncbi:MAG: hypothetical protein KDK71_07830, partial [Chlamydiia bacterium]|nr:hypothetical protein [Chlamydiia bacterium]